MHVMNISMAADHAKIIKIYGRETWHNMVTYDKLRIWSCSRFLVIAAMSIQDDRRVLERSSSEISILTLRKSTYMNTCKLKNH